MSTTDKSQHHHEGDIVSSNNNSDDDNDKNNKDSPTNTNTTTPSPSTAVNVNDALGYTIHTLKKAISLNDTMLKDMSKKDNIVKEKENPTTVNPEKVLNETIKMSDDCLTKLYDTVKHDPTVIENTVKRMEDLRQQAYGTPCQINICSIV